MTTAAAIDPRTLVAPPTQGDLLRRLREPAIQAPVPPESMLEWEPSVVATATAGALVLPREDAAMYVLTERELIQRAGSDAMAAEYALCARDRLWFLSRWVNIDSKFPMRGQRTVPFLPYPYQARTVRIYDRARRERRGIFQDKSRQLGYSWLWMALFLHGLLFERQVPFFATSHKENEVDDGGENATTDSLFGRVKAMYDALPPFLRCVPGTTRESLSFKKLLIRNADSGSFLAGEAATSRIARGSSYEVGLLDEFAHVERSESGWASADEAIAVPIASSTPLGEDNKFADFHRKLSNPRNDTEAEIRRRFLVNRAHWSEHPVYASGIARDENGNLTSPWYRLAASSKTPDKVEQEYDIGYSGSLPGRYFPEFSRGVHVVDELGFNTATWQYLSADHGLGDTEVWGLWQTDGKTFAELVDEWHTVPEGQRHGADLTSPEVAKGVLEWLSGVWNIPLSRMEAIVWDPAGDQREQTSGQSHHALVVQTWKQLGATVPQLVNADNEIKPGIMSARMLMRGSYNTRPFRFRIAGRCWLTIDSLINYRRRLDPNGRPLDVEVSDWTNHAADMVRYFCHTLFPAIGEPAGGWPSEETYIGG